jgi:hypothetical protein
LNIKKTSIQKKWPAAAKEPASDEAEVYRIKAAGIIISSTHNQ